ncbi:GNAT family N-acetyltransferase [Pantoea sp. 1.19]|uniref:GNAT family N-acetyltransferase n=1 Tax=Pantoea sp. 1.19 TaxID=1925589 RepID=UPI000948F5E7|nr:N-acetyltransferase [Pantoea sp. 1.19]
MLIRTEIGVDAAGIDALLRRCFSTAAEAGLVRQLREDGLLTLGMVAVDDDGQVLGYVAYSPVSINGVDQNWVGLAPLAVDGSVRGQGIGTQLVRESLDSLNEFGYGAVVVLGDANWYQRLGFEPARHHRLRSRWPNSESALLVCKLADGAFDDAEGHVEYAAPFNLPD